MLSDGFMLSTTGAYDDALDRYHRTGPEFEGYLSNHGPMVVEALARLGHHERIPAWSDAYLRRLDDPPRGIDPISRGTWRAALGDPTRTGDWITFFLAESGERSWADLLVEWWPRLLPGIAAGATHGVIRVGHAVRALRAAESEPRRHELAHALAYWAARWQPVPMVTAAGRYCVDTTLAAIPRVADQSSGIQHRLAQLNRTPGWEPAMRALAGPATPAEVPRALEQLVFGVLTRYATHAHGNPTMMVHAATAPMAVLNTLPSLPGEWWGPSFDAAWGASGAVLAAYSPEKARVVSDPLSREDTLDRALAHGGEHVIKLTDTALAMYDRTGEEHVLVAALTAVELDA